MIHQAFIPLFSFSIDDIYSIEDAGSNQSNQAKVINIKAKKAKNILCPKLSAIFQSVPGIPASNALRALNRALASLIYNL